MVEAMSQQDHDSIVDALTRRIQQVRSDAASVMVYAPASWGYDLLKEALVLEGALERLQKPKVEELLPFAVLTVRHRGGIPTHAMYGHEPNMGALHQDVRVMRANQRGQGTVIWIHFVPVPKDYTFIQARAYIKANNSLSKVPPIYQVTT